MTDRRMQAAAWCVLRDKEFMRRYHKAIKPEAIPRGPLRWILATALEEWDKHKSLLLPPNAAIRLEQAHLERWGTTAEEAGDLYAELYLSWDYDDDNIGALRAIAAEWFKQQFAGQILDEGSELLGEGNIEAAEKALRQAGRSLVDPPKRGLQLADLLRLPPERPAVPTGLEYFDRHWRGGPKHGHLCMVIAPSNAGKSVYLPYITGTAIKANRAVLYYTSELSEATIAKRIASALSGRPWSDLNDWSAVQDVVKAIDERIFLRSSRGDDEGASGAFLEVRYRDATSMTIRDLESEIEDFAEQGIRLNVVVLDGDDLIMADGKHDSLYGAYLETYTRLSELAERKDIVIWTAAQGTRDSFKRAIIEARDVGDSIAKVRKSTLAVGMNMPFKDIDEDGRPIMTFSIIKDRHYDTRGKHVTYTPGFGNDKTPGISRFTPYHRPDTAEKQTTTDAFAEAPI